MPFIHAQCREHVLAVRADVLQIRRLTQLCQSRPAEGQQLPVEPAHVLQRRQIEHGQIAHEHGRREQRAHHAAAAQRAGHGREQAGIVGFQKHRLARAGQLRIAVSGQPLLHVSPREPAQRHVVQHPGDVVFALRLRRALIADAPHLVEDQRIALHIANGAAQLLLQPHAAEAGLRAVRGDFPGQVRLLPVHGVHPKAVDVKVLHIIQRQLHEIRAHLGIGPVGGPGIVPAVGRGQVFLCVPHEPLRMLLRQRRGIGHALGHEIEQDSHPPRMGRVHKIVEILLRSAERVDAVIIRDGVKRSAADAAERMPRLAQPVVIGQAGHQIQRAHAQLPQRVQPVDSSAEAADLAGVQLQNRAVLRPLRQRQRAQTSLLGEKRLIAPQHIVQMVCTGHVHAANFHARMAVAPEASGVAEDQIDSVPVEPRHGERVLPHGPREGAQRNPILRRGHAKQPRALVRRRGVHVHLRDEAPHVPHRRVGAEVDAAAGQLMTCAQPRRVEAVHGAARHAHRRERELRPLEQPLRPVAFHLCAYLQPCAVPAIAQAQPKPFSVMAQDHGVCIPLHAVKFEVPRQRVHRSVHAHGKAVLLRRRIGQRRAVPRHRLQHAPFIPYQSKPVPLIFHASLPFSSIAVPDRLRAREPPNTDSAPERFAR